MNFVNEYLKDIHFKNTLETFFFFFFFEKGKNKLIFFFLQFFIFSINVREILTNVLKTLV